MKSAALALCIGVFAVLALAQPPSKPEDWATIEGTVVSAASGEPVRKAQIALTPLDESKESFDTVSDRDGRFKLVQIDPGRYRLTATRNGFLSQEFNPKSTASGGTVLTVAAGQTLRNIDFRLVPAGAVTGRVTDEDGDALAGVRIQLLRSRYLDGKPQLTALAWTITDDLGRYRLHGLPPGRYYAAAVYQDPRNALGTTDRSDARISGLGYAPLFYPGVPDVDQAALIVLSAGEEKENVDFRMARTRTVSVRGRVVNAGGLAGQVVVALSKRGGLSSVQKFYADVHEDGSFEVRHVPPGSYDLKAFMEYEGSVATARQLLDVDISNIQSIELTLRPAVEVAGRIQLEGQGKARSWEQFSPALIPLEDPVTTGDSGDVSMRPDGSFRIHNVVPGDYRLSFLPLPDDFFVKSARQGNVDVLEKGLSVSGAAGSLELVMSANGARIEGTVVDDQKNPVSGATVALVPEPQLRERSDLFKSANTDQYGAFLFRCVAPGDYKLFAWESVEADSYRDPAFLDPYEKQGLAVSVHEKSREQVQLALIPASPPSR